jgi:putative membrane protein
VGEAPRQRVQSTLDRLVRENRVTLAVTVPAVGAGLLVASSRGLVPAAVVLHPVLLLLAVGAMQLPLIAGLLPAVGRRAAIGLVGLSVFAYAVETIGVATGVPYGTFAYTADLGPMLGGVVPLALPLLYLPLVIDAYLLGVVLLGRRARRRTVRIATGVGALLLIDLVLDPGAVAVGFWTYAAGGPYYGVPVSNFLGWLLTGTIAVSVVDLSLDDAAVGERITRAPYLLDDLVSFLVLWGGINLLVGNWLSVLIASGLAVAVGRTNGSGAVVRRRAGRSWASR